MTKGTSAGPKLAVEWDCLRRLHPSSVDPSVEVDGSVVEVCGGRLNAQLIELAVGDEYRWGCVEHVALDYLRIYLDPIAGRLPVEGSGPSDGIGKGGRRGRRRWQLSRHRPHHCIRRWAGRRCGRCCRRGRGSRCWRWGRSRRRGGRRCRSGGGGRRRCRSRLGQYLTHYTVVIAVTSVD